MEQNDLLRYVVSVLEDQAIAYLLVGSLASGVYGEPRMTLDIDIVLELQSDQVRQLCGAFPAPDYYVSETAAQEAIATNGQFNVIHPASGNKIDFMIARRDDWGKNQVKRRRKEEILPGQFGFVATPEDIILGKLWYFREGGSEKHLRDIAAMMKISSDEIDRDYIKTWAEQLGFTEEWQAVLDRLQEQ